MNSGIRAEVTVDAAGTCPVTRAETAAGASTFSVSKSIDPNSPDTVTEEFVLDVEHSDVVADADAELTRVFAYGSKDVFRFTRQRGSGCPCECVEQFDCPVFDVHARDGVLHLVFHAADVAELRNVVTLLRDRYSTVDVRRLLRSTSDHTESHLVFVDRGALTDRQREVLETAHRMGYFEYPKGANAGDVAAALDIAPSTFAEHLAAAQTKLLGAILDS